MSSTDPRIQDRWPESGAPRILHLIDPATPGGGAHTLRFLADVITHVPDVAHDVIVIGSRAHGALARRCGIAIDGVICPPLRRAVLTRGALARAVRDREIERGPYDRVHAWTPAAAALAGLALPRRRRIVTPTVGPRRPRPGLPTPVFAASTSVARACANEGYGCHEVNLLAAAVDGAPGAAGAPRVPRTPAPAAARRERWPVTDGAFVAAVIAEPSSAVDAIVAVRVLARLAASGRRVHLLVHHTASQRVAAERWLGATGHRERLLVDDAVAEPWRLLPCVDAAIVMTARDPRDPRRPEPGVLPLLWAMSAGVPVVVEETETIRDVVGAGDNALVAAPRDVNALAAALARLHDDRAAARAMGTRGAARVREAFGFAAYREGLLRAYGLGDRARSCLAPVS